MTSVHSIQSSAGRITEMERKEAVQGSSYQFHPIPAGILDVLIKITTGINTNAKMFVLGM